MNKHYYPCILMLNDIHISKDNIHEFELNWKEAISICVKQGIKLIAIGGDLFMSRSSQTLDTLLAIHDAFIEAEKAGITIFLINGNHDKVNQEAIRGYCHVFDQHRNVCVGDDHIAIADKENWNFILHLIPYFPENGSFTERFEKLKNKIISPDRKNYLYLHEGINGALQQNTDNELPPVLFREFDRVFVGHYHNRNIIANTNIEYIGASRQHNFGEDEEKGYTILFNDGSCKFIKNQVNKRYKVIEVPDETTEIHLLDLIDEMREDGRNKIKVKIKATSYECNIDKEKLVKAGVSKVEIICGEANVINAAPSFILEKYDGRKIREHYQDFCHKKRIKDISMGLSYLSKINCLCGN